MALSLLILVAAINLGGGPWSNLFALPIGLAIVGLVFAVRAHRRLDIVVSSLVIAAIPLFFLGLIVLFHFAGPFPNNAFSP